MAVTSGATSTEPDRKPLGRRISEACAGVLVGLLVLNIIVATTVFYSPGRRVDPIFGNVQQPGVFVRGNEGYCITTINSDGFRAEEPSQAMHHAQRVLFLGDSYTQASQVMDSDTFVQRVQSAMRGRGRDVLCLNAGLEGTNIATYLFLAPALRKTYAPEQVVVQVGDGDFGRELDGPKKAGYWLEAAQGTWIPRRATVDPNSDRARNLLTRVPLAYWLFQRWKMRAESPKTPTIGETGSVGSIPAPVNAARAQWALAELRAAYGANVVVIYTPRIEYFGDPYKETAAELVVTRAAAKSGIRFFNLRDGFATQYVSTQQPLQGFANTTPGKGHFNRAGHTAVANQLVDILERTLPPTRAAPSIGGP